MRKQAVAYAKEILVKYPDLKREIQSLFQLMKDEIEEGGSEDNEASLFLNSVKELVAEYEEDLKKGAKTDLLKESIDISAEAKAFLISNGISEEDHEAFYNYIVGAIEAACYSSPNYIANELVEMYFTHDKESLEDYIEDFLEDDGDFEESSKNKKVLKEGYSDFVMHYRDEIREALKQVKEMQTVTNKIDLPEGLEGKIDKRLSIYDKRNREAVLGWIFDDRLVSVDDIVGLGFQIQNSYGTEPQMVLQCINDLYSVFSRENLFQGIEEAVNVKLDTVAKNPAAIEKLGKTTDITITENNKTTKEIMKKQAIIKTLTEAIEKRTGKKVIFEAKKEEEVKETKQVESKDPLEPTLGNIIPPSVIKEIDTFVTNTLAEIDKSTSELRAIKRNITSAATATDEDFKTKTERISFLLKQLSRIQTYCSNTIKAGKFDKTLLYKILELKA